MKRILFLTAKDGYFFSHRLHLALRVQAAGYDVKLVAPQGPYRERIEAAGIPVLDVKMDRQGKNPLTDLRTVRALTEIYRREGPDLVHHVAVKPMIYGTLAAKLAGVPCVVNAMAGMGYVFLSQQLLSRALRPGVKLSFRLLLNAANSRIILQNPDDLERWVGWGVMLRERIALIRGAGVDIEQFRPTPEPPGEPVVIVPARFLFDKGIGEFVEAARILRARGVKARFVLLGEPDRKNPEAIDDATLARWKNEGAVEIWPWRDDVDQALADSHVVCLPSYGEGLPKTLLEAAAAGRPIVTTDVPGCREVVRDGDNGFLVPARDAQAVACALEKLLLDPALRARFGRRGRERAETEFSSSIVADQTLALYESLLQGQPPRTMSP